MSFPFLARFERLHRERPQPMTRHAIVSDNVTCLEQAARLLGQISDAAFTEKRPTFFHSSIGGHVRHNIDHYRNFLAGLPHGRIDYESRERSPRLEEDRACARDAIASIVAALEALQSADLDAPCSVRVNTDTDDASDPDHWSGSTLRRELQFLLGHAIHHHAQVAAMCRIDGVDPEPAFGMAPSTLRHQARERNAEADAIPSIARPSSCAR